MGPTMGIHDPEQDGDLQIEVSPLQPQPSSAAAEPPPESATAQPLFAPGRSRLAQRRRGIIVVATLVVALVALTLTLAPTRVVLLGVVLGPTPTATAPVRAGEDNLYITLNPAWGTVSLDGTKMSHLPVEGIDQPFHLARGAHVIRWRFPPIIDISCKLTVPSELGDTCPRQVGIMPGKKGIASVVSLQMSLANLVPAYHVTLLSAIIAALNSQQSSEIVRVGERYVDLAQPGTPVVATQPLRATLSFVSDAENPGAQCVAIDSGPGADCAMNGDCREICTAPWQTPAKTFGGPWQGYTVAHEEWSYATLQGHVVAANQPDIGGELQFLSNSSFPVPVTITWDGSTWKVTANIGTSGLSAPLPDLTCASAWATIQYNYLTPPTTAGWGAATTYYIPGDPPATGCLLAVTAPGQKPILLLHRFGVLLAANAATPCVLERCLPVPDAYEQALTRQLAKKLPAVAGAGT
jgi:hypothetical protein